LFETEASRLVGLDVRVNGEIDARLLPSPQLTLHEIAIGAGDDAVRARSLGIELSLGALMRGRWHATEMQLVGPRLRLVLDSSGVVQAPRLAVSVAPDTLTIDKLGVIDGKITLTDAANRGSVTLDRLWFNGEANSLLGPLRGEGAVTIGGDIYPFRLAAGRYGADGTVKLKLNVDPRDYPINIESDGTLSLAAGRPKFDGTLSVTRPAGIAGHGTGRLSQPWHLAGKVRASHASALIRDLEFLYGSQDDGLRLAGVVDFTFGKQPRFKAVLSGRQVDLDRAVAEAEGGRSSPGAALSKLAGIAGKAFRPRLPIQIGIGVDQLTLGGDVVQNVRGDVTADGGGWNLDRFEFRAPGFTQVRLSGRLAVDGDDVRFTGPADIESRDPKALTAWLEGRKAPAQSDLRPMRVHGDVTFGTEKIAIERLTAEFARKTVAGHFAYVFAAGSGPSRLDAALNAPELDLDLALGFGKALLAGSRLERPHDMAITADIGRATLAGIEGRDIKARVKVDADHWQIDRLSVADLGGAAFSAEGRVALAGAAPQGSLKVDFDARDLTPVTTLLARYAPDTARFLERNAREMAPASLRAQLTLEGKAPSETRFGINGSLGKVKIALAGEGQVDAKKLEVGTLRVESTLDADEGRLLLGVLGLDRLLRVGPGPGKLKLSAAGPARGELRVDGRITAGGLEANASGSARVLAGKPTASLQASILRADMAPLRGGGEALPVSFDGRIGVAGKDVELSNVRAGVAGTTLRGNLKVEIAETRRLQGEIDADAINIPAVIAAVIGMPPGKGGKEKVSQDAFWTWSEELFGAGAFGDYGGEVAIRARSVTLVPKMTAREFGAKLRPGNDSLVIEDMTGAVAGGHVTGALSLRSGADGLTAHAKFSLKGADAAALLHAAARPAVSGVLDLSADVEATGLSPVALVGSLRGSGTIKLANAELAGLDPRTFDTVTRAVDLGVSVDSSRIADVVRKALASGQLSVEQAEGAFTVNAGQVRLSETTARSNEADLSLSGNLDLLDGSLDARLVLSGANQTDGVRPDIFMALHGPVSAPSRTIDVSALTGWLTLRAIETQAKQVKELEEAARKRREAEQRRLEEEVKRQAAERMRQEEERKRREAAQEQNAPTSLPPASQSAPSSDGRFAPPDTVAPASRRGSGGRSGNEPVRASGSNRAIAPHARERQAPALPAPIDITPPPGPRGSGASPLPLAPGLLRPEASVGPER
jgi:large subunit ribosomal protein L24